MEGGEGVDISGAYVSAKSFTFGDDADLWLGNKSFIEVTNSFDTPNDDKPWGIHGPSSGSYAVIKAASFTKQGNPPISMTYYGKLYIDTPTHYPKDYYIVNDPTTVKFSLLNINIPVKIPRTECNPGYGRNSEPNPNAIRVICEDLSVTQASDWDFNDVVFDVKLDENNKVEITLRAAGGTLLLTVAGREVHELFKKENPNAVPAITSTSMVSTGSTDINDRYSNINLKAPKFTIDNNFGTTNVKEIAKAIPVQVFKLVNGVKDWYDIEWRKGAPSARIGVGTDYNWCDEREPINSKYSYEDMRGNKYDGFTMFSRGILNANEWYKYNGPITDEMARKMAPEYTGQ